MSERGKAASKQTYDVALWECWPSLFPEQSGLVEASGSYAAVASFMQQCDIEKVAYAAAHGVGQARIDRWTHLYLPVVRDILKEQGEDKQETIQAEVEDASNQ